MILASDIGATKTIVAAYSCDEGPRKPLAQESYMTADFNGVPGLLRTSSGSTATGLAGRSWVLPRR